MNFCPGHNFKSIEASNFRLQTQIDHIKDKCSVQEPVFLELLPFVNFNFGFLALLAEGQRAIVMVLCPLCVRPFVCACVHKILLQKTSPRKLLTGFLRNFTGVFLWWSSFKFLQIIVFYEEFWLPWLSK